MNPNCTLTSEKLSLRALFFQLFLTNSLAQIVADSTFLNHGQSSGSAHQAEVDRF